MSILGYLRNLFTCQAKALATGFATPKGNQRDADHLEGAPTLSGSDPSPIVFGSSSTFAGNLSTIRILRINRKSATKLVVAFAACNVW